MSDPIPATSPRSALVRVVAPSPLLAAALEVLIRDHWDAPVRVHRYREGRDDNAANEETVGCVAWVGRRGLEPAEWWQYCRDGMRPEAWVIGVRDGTEPELTVRLLQAGLRVIVGGRSGSVHFAAALGAARRGETYLCPSLLDDYVNGWLLADPSTATAGSNGALSLTKRQHQILDQTAEGATSKEIAHRLNVSVQTVNKDRNQLKKKLGAQGVAGLTKAAIRHGVSSMTLPPALASLDPS